MGTYADTQDVMTPALIWRPVLRGLRRERFDVDLFCDRRTRHNVPAFRHVVWPRCSAFRLDWSRFESPVGRLRSLFGNPPFDSLGEVLRHAAVTDYSSTELVLLVPLRPHRTYWTFAHSSQLEVHLPAFAFEGQTSTFPLPCCLLYWGPRARIIAPALDEIGTVVRRESLTTFDRGAILHPTMNTGSFQFLYAAWKVVQARLSSGSPFTRGPRPAGALGYDEDGVFSMRYLLGGSERAAFIELLKQHIDRTADDRKSLQWAVESIENAIAFICMYGELRSLGDPWDSDMRSMFQSLPAFVHDAFRSLESAEKEKASKKASKKSLRKPARQTAAPGKAKPKNAKPAKSGKKPPPKTAPVVRCPQLVVAGTEENTENALDAFINAKAVGDEWTMSELLGVVKGSKATVLRALRKRAAGDSASVENFGSGRGSKWRRTA